jgi:hypothetical protein
MVLVKKIYLLVCNVFLSGGGLLSQQEFSIYLSIEARRRKINISENFSSYNYY